MICIYFSAVTESVANIVEKWDFSYQKYNLAHPEKAPKGIQKNECFCFENHNISEDPRIGNSTYSWKTEKKSITLVSFQILLVWWIQS